MIASDGVNSYEATTLVGILPNIPPTPTLPGGLSANCTTPVVAGSPTKCIASVKIGSDVIFTWNFGELEGPEQGSSISHIYQQPGTYVATVTSNSPSYQGYSESATVTIQVTEEPITGLDIQGETRLAVDAQGSFTAIIKTGTNVQYFWTFGDGATGSGKIVNHFYKAAGVYDLTVVASNSVSSVTTTRPIFVLPKLSDVFTIFNNSPKPVGQPITFIAVLNPPNTPAIFYWNWGDGTITQGRDYIAAHTYGAPGKYPVTVKAVMKAGVLDTSTVAYVGVPSNEELLGVVITPRLILPNHLIQFAVQNPVAGAHYTWDFGDKLPTITTDSSVVTHLFTNNRLNLVGNVTCTNCGAASGKITDFVEFFGVELICQPSCIIPAQSTPQHRRVRRRVHRRLHQPACSIIRQGYQRHRRRLNLLHQDNKQPQMNRNAYCRSAYGNVHRAETAINTPTATFVPTAPVGPTPTSTPIPEVPTATPPKHQR